jgi:1,5-anhydro-D-fructose reductase (1,5-anhydro-D-mannitol-forming)
MTRPTKVAVLGFWHVHAADYAREVREHPDTELVAAWDPEGPRGTEGAAELGVEFVADLDQLLARDDIDAVTVTTATDQHRDVILAALRAGKHVFTEKLLAPTVAECEELIDAAAEHDVALVVSLPQLATSTTRTLRRLVDDGTLGRITYARVRMAHNGWIGGWLPERFGDPAAAIGGALTDLGCHPVYVLQHLLGPRPASVQATYTAVTSRPVEDNATVTLGYADGTIGVAEASFVTTPGAYAVEVRGTEGSVLYGFGRETLIGKGGSLGADEWTEVEPADVGEPPFAEWVRHIRSGSRPTANLRNALELTRLVVAANEAAASGTAVDYA